MSNVNFEISERAYKRMAIFAFTHNIPRTWIYRELLQDAAWSVKTKERILKRWLKEKGKIK